MLLFFFESSYLIYSFERQLCKWRERSFIYFVIPQKVAMAGSGLVQREQLHLGLPPGGKAPAPGLFCATFPDC